MHRGFLSFGSLFRLFTALMVKAVLLCFCLSAAACSYEFVISSDPADARLYIDGVEYSSPTLYTSNRKEIELLCVRPRYQEARRLYLNRSPFQPAYYELRLEKERFSLEIDVMEGISAVFINEQPFGQTPLKLDLAWGVYELSLKREGLPDERCLIELDGARSLVFSHHATPPSPDLPIRQIVTLTTGPQPKQALFSPDGTRIFVPLLAGDGFDILDAISLKSLVRVAVPDYADYQGFVEGLFPEGLAAEAISMEGSGQSGRFIVSQMTSGKLFEFDTESLDLIRSIEAEGEWTKFMAASPVLGLIAASNWLSNTISIIDYATGELTESLKTEAEPRGLIFSGDGRFLFATTYAGGTVLKFDTATWSVVSRIKGAGDAAMRHLALSGDDAVLYVSDMHNAEILEIDTRSFTVLDRFPVDNNPNTIKLTPCGRYLFVSCRGPNDPVSYLNRSPRSGRVHVIDLKERSVRSFEAGNQPTGLDISPDGTRLCVTNFKDDTIELYDISALVSAE